MSSEKQLLFTKEDSIGVITFNQPKTYNLVGQELLLELEAIQNEIVQDKSLKVVVINANGDHFSAGVDLKFLRGVNSAFIMENLQWLQGLYNKWQELPIPVIAAIHGLCYGSATELILGCDIRIAAKDAKISIPEVRFGLSPDMGGTVRLTQLVGMGQAKRLIIGCEEIDADEAYAIGLVEIVVERDQLMERTMKLAKRMAGMPPAAVRFAKQGINLANESSLSAGLLFEQAQSTYCCGTEDQNEAIDSFFEKRRPVFKNK
ncbi:MAG TPA: enoyl-CoA hydratase/isomerase family protein [Syntrophomonadaceae bacterium]|nr:enoyl-CoA hydratase/isomerase family protein [Syntrophomonadaceae bacterium]